MPEQPADPPDDSTAHPPDTTALRRWNRQARRILPGLLLVVVVGSLSWWLAQFVPRLGAVTIAILLGMIIGNLLPSLTPYAPGIQVADKQLLPLSIALLGVELQLLTLIELGPVAALIIGVSIAVALLVSMQMSHWFNLPYKLSLLIGAGSGICGSSAVAATGLAIDASETETGMSISVVNLLGTIGIFLMPALVGLLNFDDAQSGLLIGGTLQAVGQVVAAGFSVNNEVGSLAIIVKMGRVLMLGPMVIFIQSLVKQQATHADDAAPLRVPLFVIGFLVMSGLASFQWLPAGWIDTIKVAGKYLLVLAMAGIGMKIQFRSLYQAGFHALATGTLVSVAQIMTLVLLISLFV
jgi:uncharacterized integral membrane protein (TIGR00698 family)